MGMSKVENEANDAKKLAMKVKTLEMQLRQSVPKKEHHEIVSKLEKQVDSLEEDLERARDESQKTIAINKQIAGVEALIASLTKIANAQGKTLDSIEEDASARGKALTAQGKVLESVAAKLDKGTVPSQVHLHALSKIRDLEEDKRGMVRRFDYNSLEARYEELSRQLGTMVPSADYASLKEKFDEATRQMADMVPVSDYSALKQKTEELEGAIYTMVPREKFVSSQERVKELEARLAEHVPQSTYDDLVARVVSLAEAITGGELQPEPQPEPQPEASVPESTTQAIAETQPEAIEPAEPAEPEPIGQPAISAEPTAQPSVEAPVPEAPASELQVEASAPAESNVEAPATQPAIEATVPAEPVASPTASESHDAVPEVREIGSQLAELSTQAQEAQGADVIEAAPVVADPTFTFSGTDIAVKTGTEFAQAIGKLPASILETDVRSGGLEKWFAGPLADESAADSLRKIREGGAVGEELRLLVASSVAKYAADLAIQQAAPTITVAVSDDSETTDQSS
jgi:hypothetical protein